MARPSWPMFATTLAPQVVGFRAVEGILALAVTSQPDFDHTPLRDENLDGDQANDGLVFHTHWVVLGADDRVPGGFAVIETIHNHAANMLPATAPGMPMYLDSPDFSVQHDDDVMRVIVPIDRVGNVTDFSYVAVTCYLQVNLSDDTRPMLGVNAVYAVLSGDRSLPISVTDGGND